MVQKTMFNFMFNTKYSNLMPSTLRFASFLLFSIVHFNVWKTKAALPILGRRFSFSNKHEWKQQYTTMISENVYKVFCCLFLLLFVRSEVYVKKKEPMFLCFFFFSFTLFAFFCNRIKYSNVNTIAAYFASFTFPFYVFRGRHYFYLSRTHAIIIIKFSLETFYNSRKREKSPDVQNEMDSFCYLLVQKLNLMIVQYIKSILFHSTFSIFVIVWLLPIKRY